MSEVQLLHENRDAPAQIMICLHLRDVGLNDIQSSWAASFALFNAQMMVWLLQPGNHRRLMMDDAIYAPAYSTALLIIVGGRPSEASLTRQQNTDADAPMHLDLALP